MEEEYHLRKFTKEQFEQIKQNAMDIPLVRDSIDYLLSVLYEFEKYVIENISYGNKQGLRLRISENDIMEKNNPISIVDRIEEYESELSLDQRIFAANIKTLITHQMRRLHIDEMYPRSRLKNKNNYFLEEHKPDKSQNKKDRLVWLGDKEILVKLVTEWEKNQFIEEKNQEKAISNFCNKNGDLFTAVPKEKIRWCKKITELVVFIGEMVYSKYKFIATDEIWAKVCKCFLKEDGSELNPDSLAVTYQKAKPKSKGLIIKILSTISGDLMEK
jgi:hypothetical protein